MKIEKRTSTVFIDNNLKKKIINGGNISLSNLINRAMILWLTKPAFRKFVLSIKDSKVNNPKNNKRFTDEELLQHKKQYAKRYYLKNRKEILSKLK